MRGIGLVVLTAAVGFLADASHLAFIGNPMVVTVIVALAASWENSLKEKGQGALFGTVN